MLVDLKTPEAKRTLAESLLAAHKNIDNDWTIDQLRFMNEAGHAVGCWKYASTATLTWMR